MGLMDILGTVAKDALPALGPIGGVASTLINAASQRQANATNVQQSNTQYQRAVADEKAAGLNPALSYQQGGESAATVQPTIRSTGDEISNAIGLWNTLATGAAQRDLTRQQASSAQQQARLTAAQATTLAPDVARAENPDYTNAYFKAGLAKQQADLFTSQQVPTLFNANLANTNASTKNLAQNSATAAQSASLMRAQQTLNEQQFTNQWFQKHISPYINSTSQTLNAFKPAASFIP